MRIDDEVTLRRLARSSEEEVPRSELLLSDKSTGRIVRGAILEAAVEWQSCRLLFTTDDVPFEEFLTILLLDRDLHVLDEARLGGAYTTGAFSSLTIKEPSTVEFRFIGDTTWSIELFETARMRVPYLSEPRGVQRRFGFSRRFVVRGEPSPRAK